MNRAMTLITAVLFLVSGATAAVAQEGGENLSGTWKVESDMDLGDGASMQVRGQHRLKRTKTDNYDKDGYLDFAFLMEGSRLPLGRIVFTATATINRAEECQNFTKMDYEGPKETPKAALDAIGMPVEDFEGLLTNFEKEMTGDVSNTGGCDPVASYAKGKVVLRTDEGDIITKTRTK